MIAKLEKLYKIDKKLVDILNEQILANFFDFHDKLKSTKNWFGDYALFHGITDEMMDYFLLDPFYFNEVVAHLRTNYEEHLGATINFQNKALEIYDELSDYLELPKDQSIHKDISAFDHYVGIYHMKTDSTISFQIERAGSYLVGHLAKTNSNNTPVQSLKIYPNTKSACVIGKGFGEFVFDDHQEVTSLVFSTWDQRSEFIKIQ